LLKSLIEEAKEAYEAQQAEVAWEGSVHWPEQPCEAFEAAKLVIFSSLGSTDDVG
jgi:hypothetical protein